jgi:hypothetical protein
MGPMTGNTNFNTPLMAPIVLVLLCNLPYTIMSRNTGLRDLMLPVFRLSKNVTRDVSQSEKTASEVI